MDNKDEWNEIVQEEIENMVCRLRERGIDADRFEVTVKGQRVEPMDNSDIDFTESDDIESILKNLQKKGKSKEKYVACEKCGERILESKIKTYKNEKICDDCYNQIQSKKSSIEDLLGGEIITTNEGFALFLQSLLDIAQSQANKNDITKRNKKGDNENENKN